MIYWPDLWRKKVHVFYMDSLKCFLQLKKSFLFSMKILSSQRWSALCGNPQKPTETLKHWASWSRDSSLSATTVCQNHPTSSLGPSPCSKWWLRDTPGQGCWNTPRIVEYFVTWHMMEWLFRRLFPSSGSLAHFLTIWNRCSTKQRHFIVFYLTKSLRSFGAI